MGNQEDLLEIIKNASPEEAEQYLLALMPQLKIRMDPGRRPSWDSKFMLEAKLAVVRSTCISRPTGAVIVRDNRILTTGYNGALSGMPDCLSDGACYRRAYNLPEGPSKYDFCRSSHAEKNAIAFAARDGIKIEGATLYCTLHPCIDCAKLIVASGIKEVVYELGYESGDKERDNHWMKFLKDCKIKVRQYVPSELDKAYAIAFLAQEYTSARMLKPQK